MNALLTGKERRNQKNVSPVLECDCLCSKLQNWDQAFLRFFFFFSLARRTANITNMHSKTLFYFCSLLTQILKKKQIVKFLFFNFSFLRIYQVNIPLWQGTCFYLYYWIKKKITAFFFISLYIKVNANTRNHVYLNLFSEWNFYMNDIFWYIATLWLVPECTTLTTTEQVNQQV